MDSRGISKPVGSGLLPHRVKNIRFPPGNIETANFQITGFKERKTAEESFMEAFSCGSNEQIIETINIHGTQNFMLKLYKNINGELHYWETWDSDDKTATIHWGLVGMEGQDKEIKSGLFSNFRKIVQKEIDEKIKEGYAEFDEDGFSFLEIEYKIDGFGTEEDLEKRHRLEERINQTLGWTGLGHVDGGSIGSGTMELGCAVVDFEIAKRVIEQDLKDTEFGDYSRIYKMG